MAGEALRGATAAAVSLLVLVTGCTQAPNAGSARADTPTADPPASHVPTEQPATTSGPLTKADLPAADDLGRGWKPYADPGGHGYLGNGEFVRERNVHDVARSLVPLGCSDTGHPPGLPVPEYALEATFRGPGGRAAVALVLEYADAAAAIALVEQLGRLLANCPKPTADVDRPTLVVELLRPDGNTIQDVRRHVGPGAGDAVWSEVVVRRGNRVGLTIVQSEKVDFPALTADLRSAVG